jgi:hypothetical protein
VRAPAHEPGGAHVRVVGPFGSSTPSAADRFSYAGIPAISDVRPDTGSIDGGAEVTITGHNLAAVTTVTFGGVPATAVVHVSSTTLTVTSPAHHAGPVDVIAAGPGGSSAAHPAAVFTYAG